MNYFEAKNVGFSYGRGGFSIKNINFAMEPGETIAVIGPNGAGKSTLMKILARLTPGYSGEIFAEGKNIKAMDSAALARVISYIPQSSEHGFDFTVEEIVSMGRRPYTGPDGKLKPVDIAAVKGAIEEIGIYEKRKAKYNELSGGEKRMVLIARAMAQATPVIFMDEPMTYLDIHHQSMLMEAIVKMNNSGKSVLFISHGINLASEYSSRVAVMKGGEFAAFGTAKECVTENIIRDVYGFENFDIADNPRTGKPNVFIGPGNNPESAAPKIAEL